MRISFERASACTAIAIATLMLVAEGSTCRAIEYKDGDFAGPWDFVQVTAGTGGSFDVSYGGDGNPGAYLKTHTHINGNCGVIWGFGFRTDAVYDPSKDGPLTQLDYSEDAKLVDGFGGGQANGPAIRQGGNIYRAPGNATGTNFSWYPLSMSLSPASFVKVIGGSCQNGEDPFQQPDFSENGAPIEFGFFRANSQIDGQGPYDITAGIDNWSVRVNGLNYVALGDSFSSGEGVRPFLSGSDITGGPSKNVCHRSTRAYGFQLHFPEVHLNVPDFLACSGAVAANVRRGGFPPAAAPGEPAQLDRYYPPPRDGTHIVNSGTDMVSLSIGGNDFGFVDIVIMCALAEDCTEPSFRPWGANGPTYKQGIEARLPSVAAQASLTYSGVKLATEDNAAVFVLGYPKEFGTGLCLSYELAFSHAERKWMDSLGDKLNQAVAGAAGGAGVHFVPVAGAFKNHGLCDSQPWINGFVPLDYSASFHPTAVGQWAYARSLDIFIQNKVNSNWPLTPAGLPENPGGFAALAGSPPADLGPGVSFGGMVLAPYGETSCGDSRGRYVAGQEVELAAGGFGANAVVTITLKTATYQSAFTTVQADASGLLDAVVTLPPDAPMNVDGRVEARGAGGGGESRLVIAPLRLSTSLFADDDFDGVPDPCDRCPGLFDPKSFDFDEDGQGDGCDACPFDADNDLDEDGICAGSDPCPWDPQNDADADGKCANDDDCPLVANANQLDTDKDGAGDACDAAPTDPGVFAPPGEVFDLAFDDDKVGVSWTSVALTSGALTVHDVVRGALDAFPVGAATCLGTVDGDRTTDATVPATGHGFWYLVRGRNSLAAGTYGQRSNGTERVTSACP